MTVNMNKSTSYDAIIIGAGIIGTASSLGLARKGWRVLNIDSLPASGYGSTSGSCAIIRPYYSTIDGSAIAYESHFYWKDWENFIDAKDERGLIRYNDCGSLVVKTKQNNYLEPILKIMDELNIPYEHYDSDQIVARLPIMNKQSYGPVKSADDTDFGMDNGKEIVGGVFFSHGGYINDPQLATHNMQIAAEKNGSKFLFNKSVTAIHRQHNQVTGVRLDDGQILQAEVVLNAAGPHSYKINQLAGVVEGMNIGTRALRHEVAHVPSPTGYDYENEGCIFSDSDVGAYMRPEQGNFLLIGSEDPPCDKRQWVDPDNFDHNFTEQWRTQVMRAGQRISSLAIPSTTKGVVELYDVTDDWIPIYDKSDLAGYYMAIGTSGNQFKNAPIVGEMMADLISVNESGQNHDQEPVSFHLKHIDRTVSLGFYSRLREVNQASSFSVLG